MLIGKQLNLSLTSKAYSAIILCLKDPHPPVLMVWKLY